MMDVETMHGGASYQKDECRKVHLLSSTESNNHFHLDS